MTRQTMLAEMELSGDADETYNRISGMLNDAVPINEMGTVDGEDGSRTPTRNELVQFASVLAQECIRLLDQMNAPEELDPIIVMVDDISEARALYAELRYILDTKGERALADYIMSQAAA